MGIGWRRTGRPTTPCAGRSGEGPLKNRGHDLLEDVARLKTAGPEGRPAGYHGPDGLGQPQRFAKLICAESPVSDLSPLGSLPRLGCVPVQHPGRGYVPFGRLPAAAAPGRGAEPGDLLASLAGLKGQSLGYTKPVQSLQPGSDPVGVAQPSGVADGDLTRCCSTGPAGPAGSGPAAGGGRILGQAGLEGVTAEARRRAAFPSALGKLHRIAQQPLNFLADENPGVPEPFSSMGISMPWKKHSIDPAAGSTAPSPPGHGRGVGPGQLRRPS